jgi:hypothetical protein
MLRAMSRGMMRFGFLAAALCFVWACGGSEPPVESPDVPDEPVVDEPKDEPKDEPSGEEGEEPTDEPKGEAKEPEFTDGMTVNDAMAAIPQGVERVNVDQESLGKPLMDEKLYEPCKLKPTQHFKLRVAIWDGRAVGMDVSSQPTNKKLEECVREQIKGVVWTKKVKSLNTVEYGF